MKKLTLEVGRHYKTRSGNETFLVLSIEHNNGWHPVRAQCVYTKMLSDGYYTEGEISTFWDDGVYSSIANNIGPYDLVEIDYDF